MKIILLTDVQKLGKKYDILDVSTGHALNLLIPQGLAIAATRDAVKRVNNEKKRVEGERKVQEELLMENVKGLDGLVLTVSGKASDKGHLFAGFHREEIAAALDKQADIQINASSVDLEHAIKEVGEHTIKVKAAGKVVSFKLIVKAA